jgi:hypothetical protein
MVEKIHTAPETIPVIVEMIERVKIDASVANSRMAQARAVGMSVGMITSVRKVVQFAPNVRQLLEKKSQIRIRS